MAITENKYQPQVEKPMRNRKKSHRLPVIPKMDS